MGGLPDLLQYYIGGVGPIYYNITWGGGSSETPKLYYVIYEQPLNQKAAPINLPLILIYRKFAISSLTQNSLCLRKVVTHAGRAKTGSELDFEICLNGSKSDMFK